MLLRDGIHFLQRALHFKLSREQLRVIKYNYKTPVLINSCAGAGKTTLIIFSILLQIITQQLMPTQILGITFSRKARTDMQLKYISDAKKLYQHGFDITELPMPTFTTFHAFFYHLLKGIHKFRILPSYTYIQTKLIKSLQFKNVNENPTEMLKSIFELRSLLIDNKYSWDGLNLINQSSTLTNLIQDAQTLNQSNDKKFYLNYRNVIKVYKNYKAAHGLIDFNDMKVNVYRALRYPKSRKIIKNEANHYKLCFIDEFQDIDDLQWLIINKIMSADALNRITAVGDDDQSIYSFRGSDPDIILNFAKDVKNTKIFNLSANYRTGSQILKSVIPLITSNKYRLKKRLRSRQPHAGQIIEYQGNKYISGGKMLLKDALHRLHSNQFPGSQIAILTRYNINKIFAIDQLANAGYYVKPSSNKDIIQNNYIYRIFKDLIQSLWDDDFSLFRKHAGQIGFSSYRWHISHVVNFHHSNAGKKLSKFIKLAKKFDSKYYKKLKSFKNGRFALEDDRHVIKAIKEIYNTKNRQSLGERLLQSTAMLINPYFNFMIRKNYIDETLYTRIKNYLATRLSSVQDLDKFFKNEQRKKNILENYDKFVKKPASIQLLTLHQSKGLQFNYVYLYDLTDHDVDLPMVMVNDIFAPNITAAQFIYRLLSMTHYELKAMGSHGKALQKLIYNIKNNILKYHKLLNKHPKIKEHYQAIHLSSRDTVTSDLILDNSTNHNLQNQFNAEYEMIVNISKTVEEERRLIYVGMTRAVRYVALNVDNHANPLLSELKLSPKNIRHYIHLD